MIAIERMTQKLFPGKWEELETIDKKYNVVEARLGFPQNKKRYQCMIGSLDSNTLIVERQWPSLAVMEATYEKAFAEPGTAGAPEGNCFHRQEHGSGSVHSASLRK